MTVSAGASGGAEVGGERKRKISAWVEKVDGHEANKAKEDQGRGVWRHCHFY